MTMLAMRNSMVGMLACAIMLGAMSAATAQTQLKVMVFPGLSNLSIYAAQHKNLFAKHGLAIELAKADVAIVTGGDNGFNRIFVQPEINAYAELRGKTVVVDAPNTAFAL